MSDLIGEIVTAAHLEPDGWQCEACGQPFKVGDEAVGCILSYAESTERDMEVLVAPEDRADLSDEHIPVFGDFRCRPCWDADRPVSGGQTDG